MCTDYRMAPPGRAGATPVGRIARLLIGKNMGLTPPILIIANDTRQDPILVTTENDMRWPIAFTTRKCGMNPDFKQAEHIAGKTNLDANPIYILTITPRSPNFTR